MNQYLSELVWKIREIFQENPPKLKTPQFCTNLLINYKILVYFTK